jgi:hypothetical protein
MSFVPMIGDNLLIKLNSQWINSQKFIKNSPLLIFNATISLKFATVLRHERGDSTQDSKAKGLRRNHKGNQGWYDQCSSKYSRHTVMKFGSSWMGHVYVLVLPDTESSRFKSHTRRSGNRNETNGVSSALQSHIYSINHTIFSVNKRDVWCGSLVYPLPWKVSRTMNSLLLQLPFCLC